jgi:hypothetical protein
LKTSAIAWLVLATSAARWLIKVSQYRDMTGPRLGNQRHE